MTAPAHSRIAFPTSPWRRLPSTHILLREAPRNHLHPFFHDPPRGIGGQGRCGHWPRRHLTLVFVLEKVQEPLCRRIDLRQLGIDHPDANQLHDIQHGPEHLILVHRKSRGPCGGLGMASSSASCTCWVITASCARSSVLMARRCVTSVFTSSNREFMTRCT